MSETPTTPPGTEPPKRPEAEDGEAEDRTILGPMPAFKSQRDDAAEDAEDDRTVLGTTPPVEDPDRTILADMPETEDPDRTILQSTPPGDAAPQLEDDRTILGTTPPEDATVVAVPPVPGAGTVTPPPTQPAPQYVPPQHEPTRTLQPGTIINNMYRVEYSLDQGGMGRVFRGVEIGTGEPVAIKVILPEMADEAKVADMFRREARTLRQLHHDAIVRYFAYVPPDSNLNLHALVMGFIEGTKLSDRIKQVGPLNRDETCRLFIRLADGLQRAHEIGVVHRDLSPDNVMLQAGEIDKAVLIDFGISRSNAIKDVTIGNEFAGKLKYVSPEQLGAFGGEADARSDVYSLALLMITSVTGRAAPMGDTIVDAVKMREAVPDLTGVPMEFQSLLYQMLQPDPTGRMADMNAVKAGLEAIAGGGSAATITSTPGMMPEQPVTDVAVPGLQAAPGSTSLIGVTATGFGKPTSRTIAPLNAATPPLSIADPIEEEKSKSGVYALGAAAVVAALAIGGALYWSQSGPGGDVAGGDETAESVSGELTRIEGSPAAYLAEAVPQDGCAYASIRGQGSNEGMIESFAPEGTTMGNLGTGFSAEFGDQPAVLERKIDPAQCAVLALAQQFQGTRESAIELSMEAHEVSRQDGIVGRITGNQGRTNWLAIVAPNGRVFSLTGQLEPPGDGQRRFSFRIPSAQPGVYLVLALASEKALARTGAMQDGTFAEDLLPLIARELAGDGQGAVDVAFLNIES